MNTYVMCGTIVLNGDMFVSIAQKKLKMKK